MFMPPLATGTVFAHLPGGGGYVFMFRNAQILSLNGSMAAISMNYDFATPLTISQKPLPHVGSWVMVAFPNGSDRNGLHLASYNPAFQDAITATTTDASGAHIDYDAYWSGAWRMVDGQGQSAFQWPDGSYFISNTSGALPTVYRNIVTSGQARQQIPYTMTDRVKNPPATFWKKLVAGTTTVSIDPSGNVSVSGAASSTMTFAINGTTITMASGNVTVNLAGGKEFIINNTNDALTLVSKMVSVFNAHTHLNSGGTGTGGTVSTPISAGDIKSDISLISG